MLTKLKVSLRNVKENNFKLILFLIQQLVMIFLPNFQEINLQQVKFLSKLILSLRLNHL